jgi:hypothetical protein
MLDLPAAQRAEQHLSRIYSTLTLSGVGFIRELKLEFLRFSCCRYFSYERLGAGQELFHQVRYS